MPFRIPFAGEGEFFTPDSVLSHCYGALLPMFTTKEATTLRLLCKEFKTTVADFPWEDHRTVIRGSVASWRACFPRARSADVSEWEHFCVKGRMNPVVDADFVHFVGLKWLRMWYCTGITDAAFIHLKGIHTLNMRGCYSITDAAFVHLEGIDTLRMGDCSQPTITDAAFVHLKGIRSLNMVFCSQDTITDAAFVHLKGIQSLNVCGCTQLTSAVLQHLKGVKRLNMAECVQLAITSDNPLEGIEWLGMHDTSWAQVQQAKSFGYPVEYSFNME
jgi:hypothetical protein